MLTELINTREWVCAVVERGFLRNSRQILFGFRFTRPFCATISGHNPIDQLAQCDSPLLA